MKTDTLNRSSAPIVKKIVAEEHVWVDHGQFRHVLFNRIAEPEEKDNQFRPTHRAITCINCEKPGYQLHTTVMDEASYGGLVVDFRKPNHPLALIQLVRLTGVTWDSIYLSMNFPRNL